MSRPFIYFTALWLLLEARPCPGAETPDQDVSAAGQRSGNTAKTALSEKVRPPRKPFGMLSAESAADDVSAGEAGDDARAETLPTMAALDDARKLGPGDRVTYRVIEDHDEPQSLTVTDSGDLQIPYYGLVHAAGKTSLEFANEVKGLLEKQLYYRATVILAIEVANKTRVTGKVYVTGKVRNPGGYEILAKETFTVTKAILSAGGFSDFSDKRHVRLVRKTRDGVKTFVIDVLAIWNHGDLENDVVTQPDDLIVVPARLVNF